jgi:peptide-methionine (S)-S-oxide reductase
MTATSGSGKSLPAKPSEEHLRKEAKRLAKSKGVPIAQAQRQLAQDYGFPSWPKLLTQVRGRSPAAAEPPPLIRAVIAGDLAGVERAIAAGEPLDATVEGQGSPLWLACDSVAPAATRLAIVTRLLDAGANPRTGTPFDKVPLHAAARLGPWSLVELLIRRGAVHWQDDSRGRTAVDYARKGDAPDKTEIVHKLSRPVLDDADFAAAVAAIHAGDLPGLKRLLDAHPDLIERRAIEPDCYPRDYFRDPKLIWFVANNPDVMREVPAEIAEIAREIAGRSVAKTDLDYTLELAMSSSPAPWRNRQPALLQALLDAGASPTREAVLMTLGHGQREPVRQMLRRGLDLTAPIAAGLGQTEALSGLLSQASQAEKQAALSMAVMNGEHEAARLSLAAGADPNARMVVHRHCMPAHSAVSRDDAAMLKLLVEQGARLDVVDTSWNSTPIGWARFLKKLKVQAFLASLDTA